jgi:hypothetical protein
MDVLSVGVPLDAELRVETHTTTVRLRQEPKTATL